MDKNEEKPHQPTDTKLQNARKKGEIVRSQEITIALSYVSLFLTMTFLGQYYLQNISYVLRHSWHPAVIKSAAMLDGGLRQILIGVSIEVVKIVSPLFILTALLVIIFTFIQKGFIFTGSNLTPKIERISIISGFKKKFGPNGIFEFIKSFTKLLLYSSGLIFLLYPLISDISLLSRLSPHEGIIFILTLTLKLLASTAFISISIALVDYIWQYHQFMKKNMMSYQDLKEEMRESDGDPHFKGVRRQRAIELASNRMLNDVPEADVIIVNPTHYAVALEWDPTRLGAPIVVAKGVDEIAIRIKLIGIENGVPIFTDVPTARSLFADTKVGEQIDTNHYAAVAAAVRFAKGVSR